METVYDLAEGGFISMTTLPRILMSRATFPMLLQQLYYAWILHHVSLIEVEMTDCVLQNDGRIQKIR